MEGIDRLRKSPPVGSRHGTAETDGSHIASWHYFNIDLQARVIVIRLTIGKKLGFGFFAVLALMVMSSAIVLVSVGKMDRAIRTVASCDQMLNGLNHAMAALRGNIILGDDAKQAEFFKGERLAAWDNIEAGMSGILADAANAETIEGIKRDLPPLRRRRRKWKTSRTHRKTSRPSGF